MFNKVGISLFGMDADSFLDLDGSQMQEAQDNTLAKNYSIQVTCTHTGGYVSSTLRSMTLL